MASTKTKKSKAKKKPNALARAVRWVFRGVWRLFWWISLRVAVVSFLVLGGAVLYYYASLPAVDELLDGRERGSVVMTDRSGEVFAWRGEQFGGNLSAGASSPHLVNAVVATEDRRFMSHFGIDPIGVVRAAVANFQAKRVVQGGSTITQQVGANGFEAASQRYFGKSAREVNIPEAAMLAGLLKAPSRYSPTTDLSVAQNRAGVIVGLMEAQNLITGAEANAARAQPAILSKAAERRAGGYFADWVMEDAPDFLTTQTTEDVEILTTFDRKIQRSAEEALNFVFENKVKAGSRAQAAIVVMSPDGAVRAMVGGRSLDGKSPGQFNRATQALRQTGSVFKPFVYAAALEMGFSPNDIVEDTQITIDVPGSGPWTAHNYTKEYYGPVPLTYALGNSLNAATIRLSQNVGTPLVRAVAQDFGISSPLAPGPAFVLGTSEATLLEMTGAYAGFLNGGRQSQPYGLTELRLRGDDTALFETGREFGQTVINERATADLVYMLNYVVEEGSGQRARLSDRQAAGKTGTTQGARDAWFIGFTGHYVTGVWMGYDDNSKLSGVTGGGLPAEIWREVMERIHVGLPPKPLPMNLPAPQVAGNQLPLGGTEIEPQKNIIDQLFDGLFGSRNSR